MKVIVPIGSPGMVFTESAIQGLREQVGTVLPLKANDEVVGEATIVDVLMREDGPALEIETSGKFVDGLEDTMAAMMPLSIRAMPTEEQ